MRGSAIRRALYAFFFIREPSAEVVTRLQCMSEPIILIVMLLLQCPVSLMVQLQ